MEEKIVNEINYKLAILAGMRSERIPMLDILAILRKYDIRFARIDDTLESKFFLVEIARSENDGEEVFELEDVNGLMLNEMLLLNWKRNEKHLWDVNAYIH